MTAPIEGPTGLLRTPLRLFLTRLLGASVTGFVSQQLSQLPHNLRLLQEEIGRTQSFTILNQEIPSQALVMNSPRPIAALFATLSAVVLHFTDKPTSQAFCQGSLLGSASILFMRPTTPNFDYANLP